MSDFNIEDYLNSPETKAFVRAKRQEIMGAEIGAADHTAARATTAEWA